MRWTSWGGNNPAIGLVAIALCAGAYLVLRGVGDLLLYGDEFHSLQQIDAPYFELIRRYGVNGSGSFLLIGQRIAVDLFGASPTAYRLPSIAAGLAAIAIAYPTGVALVGRTPAALATLALALHSTHVFYSRFGRSYAATVFLSLLLVFAITRALERDKPSLLRYLLVGLAAGLLPFAHLTASAFVLATGGAAVLHCTLRAERRHHLAWLISSLLAGALLCAWLYLPAREPLTEFIAMKAGYGKLGEIFSLDTLSLLAGSRARGLAVALATLVSAAWLATRKGSDALLLLAAAFSMWGALALSRPLGDAYAYSRYTLAGLPFCLMLLAWLFANSLTALLRALGAAGSLREPISLALGSAALLLAFLLGPLGPIGPIGAIGAIGTARSDDGPFAASYLSLAPLAPFDAPWPGASPFYRMLAEEPSDRRIVELPELRDQAIALYRNHYLLHRKQVAIATMQTSLPYSPGSAASRHIPVDAVDFGSGDYLILHKDVRDELGRYWRFVYEDQWRGREDANIQAQMEFHRELKLRLPPPLHELVPLLRDRLGKPVYRDADITVWQLSDS